MADYMQEIETIMDDNKHTLERLKNNYHVDWATLDMFHKAKTEMMAGHKFYAIVEIDGKSHNVELVNAGSWSSTKVLAKFNDGSTLYVPMNSVKIVKC